jgi:uncharacterized protein (TIGR03067 family)
LWVTLYNGLKPALRTRPASLAKSNSHKQCRLKALRFAATFGFPSQSPSGKLAYNPTFGGTAVKKIILSSFAPLLVISLLVAAPAPKDTDQEKIQGTWKLESVESQGQIFIEQYKDWTFNIKDDKLTIKVRDKVTKEYTIKIDPDKKPKTLDLTREIGGQTVTELGIYELDSDTWKMCNDEAGLMRPTEYGTKEGTQLEVIVMKRVKNKDKE